MAKVVTTRTYHINICRTCGAHAVWPYKCGHRPAGWSPITDNPAVWTKRQKVTGRVILDVPDVKAETEWARERGLIK